MAPSDACFCQKKLSRMWPVVEQNPIPLFLNSPKKTWFDMLYINVYSNRGSNHIVGKKKRCNQHERRVDWSPIIIPFSSHYCLITRMFYIVLRNMHLLCVILYILSFIVYYTILSITFIYFIISIYIYIHYITFYYIILSITFHMHVFIELHGDRAPPSGGREHRRFRFSPRWFQITKQRRTTGRTSRWVIMGRCRAAGWIMNSWEYHWAYGFVWK